MQLMSFEAKKTPSLPELASLHPLQTLERRRLICAAPALTLTATSTT